MTLGIWLQPFAGTGYCCAAVDGGQDVVERFAFGHMKEDVSGGNERQMRLARQGFEPVGSGGIVRAIHQLGQQVGGVAIEIAIGGDIRRGERLVIDGRDDAREQSRGLVGEIRQRELTFPFGSTAAAARDQAAEAAVPEPVLRPEHHRRCIAGTELGSDDEGQRVVFGRGVCPNDPREAFQIGDGQRAVTQFRGANDQLVGMRGGPEEREVRQAMKFRIPHRDRTAPARDCCRWVRYKSSVFRARGIVAVLTEIARRA